MLIEGANLLDYLQVLLLAMLVAYFSMKEVDARDTGMVAAVLMVLFMAVWLLIAATLVIAVLVAFVYGVNWALAYRP